MEINFNGEWYTVKELPNSGAIYNPPIDCIVFDGPEGREFPTIVTISCIIPQNTGLVRRAIDTNGNAWKRACPYAKDVGFEMIKNKDETK